MSQVIEGNVRAVTVFPDRARVDLAAKVALSPGLHNLIIEDLPLVMEPDSVRMGGRGEAQVRLLSIDVRRTFHEQAPAAKVREIEDKIEQLEDEIGILDDESAVLSAHGNYLEGIRQATVQYARGLARGKMTIQDQESLGGFLQQEDKKIRDSVRDLELRRRKLQRTLEKLRQELSQLQSERPKQRYKVEIELEAHKEGEFDLDLSYTVNRAGWKPLYDIRLIQDGDGKRLEVNTIAQVTQQSGQDWTDVDLVLSTARPAVSQRLPELKPWFLDIYSPPMPRPTLGIVGSAEAAMPAKARMAAPAPQVAESMALADYAPEAELALAEVSQEGSIVRYAVPGKTNIPSDGSPHKISVDINKLEPDLDYLAIPKHTDAVFRRATAANTSPGPLLPGEASLFVENEYIGKTQVKFVPVGDELEMLLGVEDGIKVKREMTKRDVDKTLLRDRRQLSYRYEIELKNLLNEDAEIVVRDQLPVSRHEDINVKPEGISPSPTERSDMNMIEWKLTLPPAKEETLSFEFVVQHPRSIRVTGLIE